jgi:hypothetical protein
MLLKLFVIIELLTRIEGFKISDNFIQCNRKTNQVFNKKCISQNGSNEIDCLNYSKQLKEINDDEFGVVNGPNGKEVIYANGKERYATKCAKVDSIEIITCPEKCSRDLELRFNYKGQSYVGFLTKNGIIRNNSLQTNCPENYETFIKIKNFFIIKFRNKIIIKDENDIVKFELNNTNIILDKFSEFFVMVYKEYFKNIIVFFIIMTLIFILLKKFLSKKQKFSKLFGLFFKQKNNDLDDSIIILESVPVQNRPINTKRKSKDKCVQFIDYDLLESEKPKSTRSNKNKSNKQLNK